LVPLEESEAWRVPRQRTVEETVEPAKAVVALGVGEFVQRASRKSPEIPAVRLPAGQLGRQHVGRTGKPAELSLPAPAVVGAPDERAEVRSRHEAAPDRGSLVRAHRPRGGPRLHPDWRAQASGWRSNDEPCGLDG
jgi:hypothetical protein